MIPKQSFERLNEVDEMKKQRIIKIASESYCFHILLSSHVIIDMVLIHI